MFNNRFPSSFQSLGNDPYNQVNGMGQVSPYSSNTGLGSWDTMSIGNMDMEEPSYMPMAGDETSSQLYPMENPNAISNYDTTSQPATFAKGGIVKRSMPSIAAMMQRADEIRRHGQREDTILAHINPQEAQFLAQNFGGDINPHTGLPQFGLFRNPGKWLAGSAGGGAGAILGNMVLPGVGGVIGGALGGAAGSAVRGRKDYLQAGMRGAAMGAALPSIASGLGEGAKALGMDSLGTSLSNYGNANAILPSIGKLTGSTSGMFAPQGAAGAMQGVGGTSGVGALAEGAGTVAKQGFMDKLLDDPKNLMMLASIGGQYLTKEKPKKEKSAKELGEDQKAMALAQLLNPEEMARKEFHDTELAKAQRRTKRNSYLPEERLGDLKMLYRRYLTPNDADYTGQMIQYYDNPNFEGEPIKLKKGGAVPKGMIIQEEVITTPKSVGTFLRGATKGQDDKIRKLVEEGSYILDASTVSDLGDGNSSAGNNVIDALLSDGEKVIPRKQVEKLGKGNHAKGVAELDKLRTNLRKHKRGGSTTLPPKAKPAAEYMR